MAIPMTAKASPSPGLGTTAAAHALLDAAKHADWPGSRAARMALVNAMFGLADAITNVEALAEGIHWSAIYHNLDIDLDSPEPEHEAPRIAAQDLADTTDAARKVFAGLGIDLTETAAAA